VSREYNLELARVLHCEHPIQADVEGAAAAVVPGFGWAEAGEGQGLFLCRCMKPCKQPEQCGLTFWTLPLETGGHKVVLRLPWSDDSSGELLTFDLWCCDNCEVQGTGATFDTWVGRFYDVPARLLSYVHELRSRTYIGARKSLGKRYPDVFTEGSYVTLILYRRTT
jgi:hypothetical protein